MALVRHKLNSRRGPCSHVVLHFTDTSAHQRSHLIAQPFKRSDGDGGVAVSVSLGPWVEAVVSRELVRNVYLHSPLATEFAFVHMPALKVAPILAGRSGSRQARRVPTISVLVGSRSLPPSF